jgi:hypothetical protein
MEKVARTADKIRSWRETRGHGTRLSRRGPERFRDIRRTLIALVSILLARDTLKIIRFPKYRREGAHFS